MSPLITPIIDPYIIHYLTPFKEFRLWLISGLLEGIKMRMGKSDLRLRFQVAYVEDQLEKQMGRSL